ncbi:MAG: hypothetical protein V2I51_10265, partial [Anderseniella sp.]|nr:hypothetical protein [Anderseniella sp.]
MRLLSFTSRSWSTTNLPSVDACLGLIDKAVAENKLGIYFTHQGSGLFEGDVEKVGVFRQLG